jgi:hypothetical protein
LAIAYLLACDGPILTNYEWGLKMRLTERTRSFQSALPPEIEKDLAGQLISLPNGPPKVLVAKVGEAARKAVEPLEDNWVGTCIGLLARLEHEQLGDEILAEYKKMPDKKTDLRLNLAWLSVVAGNLQGMPDIAPLMRKVTESPAEYAKEMKRCIEEVLDAKSIKEVLKIMGERELTQANAAHVWSWLLAERQHIEFQPETHTYHVKVEAAK